MKEINSIIDYADVVKEKPSNVQQSLQEKSTKSEKQKKPEMGFCIRCESSIVYNYYHPYCPDCYKTWKKFRNRNYKEKVCHSCRQEWGTTLNHPLCDICSEDNRNTK